MKYDLKCKIWPKYALKFQNMPKYAIKLKICSNGSNMPLYAIITFAWILDTPFIENCSDFDASFDSAHIEKIFCIKIRALMIINMQTTV